MNGDHRLFCHITENWRGKPLRTWETVVELIGHTSTQAGLRVRAELDAAQHPIGVETTDEQMDGINLVRHGFQGAWNTSCAHNEVETFVWIGLLAKGKAWSCREYRPSQQVAAPAGFRLSRKGHRAHDLNRAQRLRQARWCALSLMSPARCDASLQLADRWIVDERVRRNDRGRTAIPTPCEPRSAC